jgi:hypothetical protein
MSESTQVASIEPRPNGPYLVNRITDLPQLEGRADPNRADDVPVSLRRVVQ